MKTSSTAACCAILIAAFSRASSQTLPTWTIAPAVAIESDGTPATEFSRIVTAIRLSDGRIAVANGATTDIRIFDASGKYLRTFGRSGSGPGEFRWLGWVARSGDTAFFHDGGLKRLTSVLLAGEPRVVATLPLKLESDRGSLFVSGRTADGRWLIATSVVPSWDMPVGSRVKQSVGWATPELSGKINWLGQLDGMTVWAYHPTGKVERGSLVGAGAFTPWVYTAASAQTMWFGDAAADTLFMAGASGPPTAVRVPIPRRRLSEQVVAKARDAAIATARTSRDSAAIRDKYSAARLPKDLPFFESLKPGPAGELWVQEASTAESDPARYVVLGPNGVARAWVNTPPGVRLTDFGTDYVVGVHTDDDGVETVRVYRLARR